MKLRPEHIRLEDGTTINPSDVSKVHERRVVIIQPNPAARLRAYPLFPYLIIFSKHMQNVLETDGTRRHARRSDSPA